MVTFVDSDAVETALVRDYLGRLHAAGWGLAPARRKELVAEVREHIDEALRAEGAAGNHGEAAARNVLDRLGRPEDIVGVALEQEDPERRRRSFRDSVNLRDSSTVMLLLFGGFLYYFGWLVGVAMLWSSPRWHTRDKWLATLVFPLGYVGVILLIASDWWSSQTVQFCVWSDAHAGSPSRETCTGGWPGWAYALSLVILLGAPLPVAIRLLVTSRKLVAAAPH